MNTNLATGSLTRLIIKYGLPSILTMWIFALYTIVDGAFIGKFLGSNELAAVNIIMPYVNLSFALGIMIAVGGGTIIAISLGEKNIKKANETYSLSIQLFLILGSFLGGLGVFFPERLATILGANDIILGDASTYLFYLSFFTLFYLLAYGLEIFIRIDGNTTYSLTCITIGAFLNIFLDYVFILKLGMGIKGAALATGIAQLGTAMSLAHYLVFRSKVFRFRFIRMRLREIFRICFNGSSEFLSEIATGIIIIAFNLNIMRLLGEKGVSAFGIIGYISTLVTMTMIGFSQGLQPIISYNFGAKNYARIMRLLKISTAIVFILGIIFFLTTNIFAEDIISIFIKDDKALYNTTKQAINIYSFTYILMGINIIISSYFTAIEDAFTSSVLSVIRGIILINILLFTLPLIFDIKGIWLTAPINETATLIISSLIFYKLGLKRIRVEA